MAPKKTFLNRFTPSLPRSKPLVWPFAHDGDEPPRVKMRILGGPELELAHLAAIAHFAKKKLPHDDAAFRLRERAEMVWLAFRDEDDEPLSDSGDEVYALPDDVVNRLYTEWSRFQAEVTLVEITDAEIEEAIEHLKKNTRWALLDVWPSSWLLRLARSMASQLAGSTEDSSSTSTG